MWRGIGYSILSLVVALACGASGSALPEGWRFPTEAELSDEVLRADSPTRYARAAADFNADGTLDEAVLVKATRSSGEALLVHLSCGVDCFEWVTLSTSDFGTDRPNVPLLMGVDLATPGTYEYICVEINDDCVEIEEGVRPQMTIGTPAVAYFRFESASSFFYWNDGKFIRVWTSD